MLEAIALIEMEDIQPQGQGGRLGSITTAKGLLSAGHKVSVTATSSKPSSESVAAVATAIKTAYGRKW
jgi:hypothetical protein